MLVKIHEGWTQADGTVVEPYAEDIRYKDSHRHKFGDAIAEYLYTKGLDYADQDTGSVEWDVFIMRFGKRLLINDDRGFVWCETFPSEAEAIAAFEEIDAAYAKWEEE